MNHMKQKLIEEYNNHFRKLESFKKLYKDDKTQVIMNRVNELIFQDGVAGINKWQGDIYAFSVVGPPSIDFNNQLIGSDLQAHTVSHHAYVPGVKVKKRNVVYFQNNPTRQPTVAILRTNIEKLVDIFMIDNYNLLLSNKKIVAYGTADNMNTVINEALELLEVTPIIAINENKRNVMEKSGIIDINKRLMTYDSTYTPVLYSQHFKDVYSMIQKQLGIEHNASAKRERNNVEETNLDISDTLIMNDMFERYREISENQATDFFGLDFTEKEKEVTEDEPIQDDKPELLPSSN